MPKAIWNGQVIADSETTVKVEGNDYFPHDSLNKSFFQKSEMSSVCPWKGTANYYDVVVDGKVNKDAAWYYPSVKEAAVRIKDHVAFWKGVEIK